MIDPDASIVLTELLPRDVEAVLEWRYPDQYRIYDLAPDDESKLAQPDSTFWAVRQNEELIGFVCTGVEARVPGMLQDATLVDLGVGIRPDLIGRGASRTLMPAIVAAVARLLGTASLRVTIAKWNVRAQRAAEHAGFMQVAEHHNDRGAYVILVGDRRETR